MHIVQCFARFRVEVKHDRLGVIIRLFIKLINKAGKLLRIFGMNLISVCLIILCPYKTKMNRKKASVPE
jgi:hypothetical protein